MKAYLKTRDENKLIANLNVQCVNLQIAFCRVAILELFFNRVFKIFTKGAQNWLKINMLNIYDAIKKLTTPIFDFAIL